jgi:hypothetical protein
MAITPARERVRKSRERKRRGVIPVQVEVSTLEIDFLRRRGYGAWSFRDLHDATPGGGQGAHARDMFLGADDRQLFEALPVKFQLLRQAHQRVGGAFDFEAVQAAIDDGNIDSGLGMRKAEFVDDEGVVAAVKGAQGLAM